MKMALNCFVFIVFFVCVGCYGKSLDVYLEGRLQYKEGGRHPVSSDDPRIVNASRWAAEKIGGKLLKVIRAEEQIVSGWMYYIDMNVAFLERMEETACSVKVWTQEWHHSRRLMYYRCEN